MNATWAIQQAVMAIPEGKPFFPAQFLSLGTRASVDKVLSRVAAAGGITRIARGVYVRPKRSRYVSTVIPGPGEIAAEIAASERAMIQVHGAEAARRLELTTQVPVQSLYYTSGRSRTINVGRLKLKLLHASPRKFVMANTHAGLALVALAYLGKKQVTPEVVAHVRRKLSIEEFETLKRASTMMPAWLSEALNREDRVNARAHSANTTARSS